MTPEEPRPELEHREARPLSVHLAVDAAIAFLVLLVVLLILEVSIWVIVGISVVIGALAAPFTRRAEARALAQRYPTGGGSPSD